MGRLLKLIDLEEFKKKIDKLMSHEDFPYNMGSKIDKDLSKIQFDWENYEVLELKTSFPGCHYQLMYAGGDWEYPVYFMIYWDGKNLRAYIPEEGNTYDKEYKTAYGSQTDTELYDKKYGHLDCSDPLKPDFDTGEASEPDFNKMELDFYKRIEIIK